MTDHLEKYSYGCLLQDVHLLQEKYSEKLKVGVAGYSVWGRKLIYLSVGKGENTLLMLGTHHGREYITSLFLMRLLEDYLRNAPHALLQKGRLIVLPMVNPDGAEISIRGVHAADSGIAAMPVLSGGYCTWKANANGVDLNRNYPCLWEKKKKIVTVPSSEMYNGPFAASEPEVRAVMKLTENIMPRLAVTMHTKGEEIYYADANITDVHAESLKYASRIAALSGYTVLPPSQDPAVFAAGYENWFRERFRKPCILIEAGKYDGPQPFCEGGFETEIWEKLRKIGIELMNMLIFP